MKASATEKGKAQTTPSPKQGLFVGIDVGSSCVHCVVLNVDRTILYSGPPIVHFAYPGGALREAWKDVCERFPAGDILCTAFTGSGAEALPKVMEGAVYLHDSVAIPKGAGIVAPDARYVFHIGAKDAYFFNVGKVAGQGLLQEWRTGTKCGGGSGTLIEKQCRRLFEGEVPNPQLEDVTSDRDTEEVRIRNRRRLQERLEEMFRRAEDEAVRSLEPSEFLARCGVVVQSDLIHKQNEGATRVDNLAGLFRTVARNYRIDVLGAREFNRELEGGQAIVTGGVLSNDLVRQHLADLLGIAIGRPDHYRHIAAIGVALKAIEENSRFAFQARQLDEVARFSRERRKFARSLADSLDLVHKSDEDIDADIAAGTEVVLGIDGGSTTTKGALVDLRTGQLLDKLYIKTHGDPERSLKRVLRYLSRHQDQVIVKGVGATGSARKLYEKILLSKKRTQQLAAEGVELVDRITDEITCHAVGVKHYNPEIDTIFEVGGQDMKFTSFSADGSVKEAKMNYSCQAGSGQTLENMADVINLRVEDSLQEAALRAKRVPIIDSTCGVFMEMDENRLIAEGFGKDEIAAAIVRGTAASYYFKFVGGAEHAGQKCSAQGGPALGLAFLAAMAQVSGKRVDAYPHREMFGAWGQALDIIEGIRDAEKHGKAYGTAFRGWGLVDMPFAKRKILCRELFGDKTCGVRDCELEVFSIEDDEIVTGGFCPRGNSEASKKPKTNYVERYHKIYERHFKKHGSLLVELDHAAASKPTVGIKRSMATLGEKGVWSAALFAQLGFHPVVTPRSTKDIAKVGVDNSRTEFCIARKLATGHAAILNDDPRIEYLFNPSFIQQRQPKPPDLKYCIYTESEGYVLNDVLSLDKNRQINPILHFGDRPLLVRELRTEFRRLGLAFSTARIKQAIDVADAAEAQFKEELYREGEKFLEGVERADKPAYVGLGRDYVLLDPEASSNSGTMFAQVRGLDYIPQVFLEPKFMDIPLDDIVANEFWVQSVKILKAGLYVADHPKLFAIRMMNFACGPDSLKVYQEQRIQEAANKPLLVLLTDAQTNNAPFVTRTEAHERVVDQTVPVRLDVAKLKRPSSDNYEGRTWMIPYMGDASHVAAAGLRSFGVDSAVLPTNTERGYEVARKHIYTEVCQPLKGVVGDAIGFLQERIEQTSKEQVEGRYLVMLPTTSGPCRFGKYTELVQRFMADEGLAKVPVVGPSAETDYIDVPLPGRLGSSAKMAMQKLLFKGVKASDLLEDTFRRFRPYVADKEALREIKDARLAELVRRVVGGARTSELVEWGHETVRLFEGAELRTAERFPLVLYIGEIYMRQHDPYTYNVIEQLEDIGLEVVRDPITDWLFYVNQVNLRNAKRDVALGVSSLDFRRAFKYTGKLAQSLVKSTYMKRLERAVAHPFHHVLAGRHVLPAPMEIIDTLQNAHETHANIQGESPLSTGIAYHLMHELTKVHGDAFISGIFHVGPFTCMQEGVATAKIEAMAKELRKKKPDLVFPIVHAFFGDSPNANLDSEIAVFKEQCYQKRELLRRKGEGVAAQAARATS